MAKERVAELQMNPNRIVTSKLPYRNGLLYNDVFCTMFYLGEINY